MKRRLLGICLSAILVLASPVSVFAEDYQGKSGWAVSFDGRRMESNFTSGDMGNEINTLQPGDSIELTVTLQNRFDGQADWYMKNEVLNALEDAGNAAGGAYDYLLTYTDVEGETTTLYSSEKFGGDGRFSGVGLHGVTTSLDDYFYLDRMGNGESGVVKLKVALDGETLVNNYQNTYAKLQMDFATELVSANTTTPGDGGQVIKTGDHAQALRYMALMLGAGLALLLLVFVRLCREREEETVSETNVQPGLQEEETRGTDRQDQEIRRRGRK